MARRKKKRKQSFVRMVTVMLGIVIIFAVIDIAKIWIRERGWKKPEELLMQYMAYIPKKEYDQMYAMLYEEASEKISKEDFINRNQAIYEGIEVKNMTIKVLSYDAERLTVTYQTSFDTIAGKIYFDNEAHFQKEEEGYRLIWEDSLIFPGLTKEDKVRVTTTQAERGEILDRNGQVLAGKGIASSVGIVPGKWKESEETIAQIAKLLNVEPETIQKKLSAEWVEEDSFVPIKTIPKEQEKQEALLQISGVMITDVAVREYPLGEAAAHLIGYVQNVTAEDLEKHAGEGYTENSVIGKSGMEGLFEEKLRGQNGCRIYIVDAKGEETEELACKEVEDGQDVQLTIDANLQNALYEQFQKDKSCSVAMQPYTGEVLALVSTPSYDNNDFIMGLSDEQWTALNEDENKPMYNRFRQVWCPGSTFKTITAAIGLESGAIDPTKDYGTEGLRWQKDASWGSYYVTTLHEYEPVILENALIYSDNIYFAKAALRIGAAVLEHSLTQLGFQQQLPFEITMAQSQYSNTEKIETEIQLADSGYGQGEILMNPLHLACVYSAFCNEGNIVKPYLQYQNTANGTYWIPEAFSDKTAARILEGTKKVINDPNGTGYAAHREEVILAGKTGTAEIKASKEDTSGTELGWFAVYTAEKNAERPILLISMVEDVKERGGSGYVVKKDNAVLDAWFLEDGIKRLSVIE